MNRIDIVMAVLAAAFAVAIVVILLALTEGG